MGPKNKSKLQSKKSKVTQNSTRLSSTTILIAGMLAIMVGVGIYISTAGTGENPASNGVAATAIGEIERIAVGDPIDYTQARVDMTNIEYETEGDFVKIALDDVKENKLTRFEFKSDNINEKTRNFAGSASLPMMAMVDPAGKLMVAVSYCEPCRSTTFHTEQDNALACNKCGTKWDLTTLSPIAGACQGFPPDEIKVEVIDGKVLIPKADLENWVPREDT